MPLGIRSAWVNNPVNMAHTATYLVADLNGADVMQGHEQLGAQAAQVGFLLSHKRLVAVPVLEHAQLHDALVDG